MKIWFTLWSRSINLDCIWSQVLICEKMKWQLSLCRKSSEFNILGYITGVDFNTSGQRSCRKRKREKRKERSIRTGAISGQETGNRNKNKNQNQKCGPCKDRGARRSCTWWNFHIVPLSLWIFDKFRRCDTNLAFIKFYWFDNNSFFWRCVLYKLN